MNLLIFILGFIIFIVYVYFLLTIVSKQHKIQRSEHQQAYDEHDMDGIGNQGRFPIDKSKKEATESSIGLTIPTSKPIPPNSCKQPNKIR